MTLSPADRTTDEFYGPDNLRFATGYPYGGIDGRDFMHEICRAREELDISAGEKGRIYSGNLSDLIGSV